MSKKQLIVIAAGGTGGHLFPALSVANDNHLQQEFRVKLFTDKRGLGYAQNNDGTTSAIERKLILSGGIAQLLWWERIFNLLLLLLGTLQSLLSFVRERPRVVAGFGGYPSLPPLLAAKLLGIPTLVHEQNSSLGGANRLLARICSHLALSFEQTSAVPSQAKSLSVTGNPVRQSFQTLPPYQAALPDNPFELLIFGGSQGAAIFAQTLPQALALLPRDKRKRLNVSMQVRPENVSDTIKTLENAQIKADVRSFYTDMAQRISNAHLIICRAGASSVAEIACAGRPAAFVPLPSAIENHQHKNAMTLAQQEACFVWPQQSTTCQDYCTKIEQLMDKPELLAQTAANCAASGLHANASRNLVALITRLAGNT